MMGAYHFIAAHVGRCAGFFFGFLLGFGYCSFAIKASCRMLFQNMIYALPHHSMQLPMMEEEE